MLRKHLPRVFTDEDNADALSDEQIQVALKCASAKRIDLLKTARIDINFATASTELFHEVDELIS